MWGSLPDGAHPGLPLEATIGQVPAPYCPRATMVNEFIENTLNTNKTQLLTSNNGTFRALVIGENFIPQNGPSTQLIDAKSFVQMRRARSHF